METHVSDDPRDLILGSAIVADPRTTAPSGTPLVVALARAGALGILDIEIAADVTDAVAAVAARTAEPFAIRPGAALAASGSDDLGPAVTTVVLDAGIVRTLDDDALAAAIGRW